MLMARGDPQPGTRLAFEIEFNHYCRLVSFDPSVVSGFNHEDLRCGEFLHASISEFHVNTPGCKKADMGVHAEIRPGMRLDVSGPAKTNGIDGAPNACISSADSIELNSAKFAMFCVLHGRK